MINKVIKKHHFYLKMQIVIRTVKLKANLMIRVQIEIKSVQRNNNCLI